MTRDFSNNVKNDILELINLAGNCDFIDYDTPEIDEYEDAKDEIEECIQKLYEYKQELKNMGLYDGNSLFSVFNKAIIQDNKAAKEILEYEEVTYDSYMDSMMALLEIIRVTPEMQAACTVNYLSKDEESHILVDRRDVNGSIFTDTEIFANKIAEAGNGLLGITYEKLYPTNGDWTAIDELMRKDKYDVEVWELAALSQVIDTYIIQDKDAGNVNLDCEGYAVFLEHCCIQRDSYDGNYKVSPVCGMLSEYRNEQTKLYLVEYGKYINCTGYKYEKNFITTQCYINDSLYGLYEYGKPEDNLLISELGMNIDVSIESDKVMTLSIRYGAESYKDINIFGLSSDIGNELTAGQNAAIDGEISNLHADRLQLVASNIVGKIPGGETINNICSFDQINTDAESEEEAAEKEKWTNNFKEYLKYMRCGGTVIQCGDEYTVNNLTVNENQLAVDVAFYNYFNEQGNETSVEELEQEFNNFLNGEGSYDNLVAFYDFQYGEDECTGEYELYVDSINEYLDDEYDTRINSSNLEQIEDAIIVEKYVCNEYKTTYADASFEEKKEIKFIKCYLHDRYNLNLSEATVAQIQEAKNNILRQ